MSDRPGTWFPLISDSLRITRSYGRRKLLLVFLLVLAQAVLQVVGVGSVYPFLAVASEPASIQDSRAGSILAGWLPGMDDRQLLLLTGVAAIAMLLISNAANLISEIGRVRYARGFGHWLSMRLMADITNRPYGYFLDRNSGELFKKVITDVPMYVNSVLIPLLEAGAKAITVIFLVAFLVFLSPSIALGACLFFGIFYLVAFGALRGLRRRISNNLKIARRGVSKEATQLLGGIKPVKVHDVREHFLKRFAVHSRTQARESGWIPLIGNSTRYLVEPLAFGGLVVIVLVASGNEGTFNRLIPTLGVMALAAYRLLPAAQALYNSLTKITTARHAVDEVVEEFSEAERNGALARERRPAKTEPAGRRPAVPLLSEALVVENLKFAYAADTEPIFNGLSFEVPAKSSFAIVGRTGSGKSTLVDILLGLHSPSGGRILVDGVEVKPENAAGWRAQIGYVPQEIFLLDDTLAANIAFGVPPEEVDRDRLREAARRAQILDFIESELPQGFDSPAGERGVRLSGGQRQRIGLARALYRRPRVLVLDEATSALDVETEAALVSALEELHGELTMIVIAHRLSTIERCENRLDLSGAPRRELLSAI